MMDQRTAATFAFRCDDFNAKAIQKTQGCSVDAGIEHRLGAAIEDRHSTSLLALGGTDRFNIGGGWQLLWSKIEHCRHRSQGLALSQKRRKRLADLRKL